MTRLLIKEMVDTYGVPMILDAGVDTASTAALAMDHAVIAGRLAFESGRRARRLYASASSPLAGVIGK